VNFLEKVHTEEWLNPAEWQSLNAEQLDALITLDPNALKNLKAEHAAFLQNLKAEHAAALLNLKTALVDELIHLCPAFPNRF